MSDIDYVRQFDLNSPSELKDYMAFIEELQAILTLKKLMDILPTHQRLAVVSHTPSYDGEMETKVVELIPEFLSEKLFGVIKKEFAGRQAALRDDWSIRVIV